MRCGTTWFPANTLILFHRDKIFYLFKINNSFGIVLMLPTCVRRHQIFPKWRLKWMWRHEQGKITEKNRGKIWRLMLPYEFSTSYIRYFNHCHNFRKESCLLKTVFYTVYLEIFNVQVIDFLCILHCFLSQGIYCNRIRWVTMTEEPSTLLIATKLFPILVNEQYIYLLEESTKPIPYDEHMHTVRRGRPCT